MTVRLLRLSAGKKETPNRRGENMMKREAGAIALGHIGLNVSDIEISKMFYQEIFGLRVVNESLEFPFEYASLARDGVIVLTLWEHATKRLKMNRPGLHHLAFEADSIEEVNRTKGLLENLGGRWGEGAQLYPEIPKSDAIHFEDPDGIRIEVYYRTPSDVELREGAPCGVVSGVSELCA
jgi:lactoylglutathione lyase